MRQSLLFTKTSKTSPSDEVSKNAQLLIQAGFIYKEMAGVYSFLPLGLRVLENIKKIIKEEMDNIGAQEIIMSSMQSKSVWEKTKRWDDNLVDVWFKSKLKSGREIGFGWSHEEPITNMMIEHINSYKDLPVFTYQFQTKFRNETRAKSGIMRGREFVMKDMYSYTKNLESHENFYAETIKAYHRVYTRLGLGDDTHLVYASGGAFTKFSHEFQTISEIGEDIIFKIPNENKYQNQEIVELKIETFQDSNEKIQEMQEIFGEVIGVENLVKSLNINIEKTTKTIIFELENEKLVAVAIRGDREINIEKLKNILNVDIINLASKEKIKKVTGADLGYAGMVNLPKEIDQYWDYSCEGRINFEMGGNKNNYHNININFDRDVKTPEQFFDLSQAVEGDIHPTTGEKYKTFRSVEVGNIFNFGGQKCEEMNLYYIDENGKKIPVWLGSYGIGVTRCMGLIAEKMSDEKGLIWPENIAPFKVHLINIKEDEKTLEVYNLLKNNNVETLWDDRKKRPGEKFADSDLIGLPYRLVISKKTLDNGGLELKFRETGEVKIIKISEILNLFA
jgi:prolyl-tRNA synthetase